MPATASLLARTLALAALLLVAAAPPRPADPEVVNAEETLRQAKVGTDGAALLAFFRARTLPEARRAKLTAAVRLLGSDDYETRERATDQLIAAGRGARPFLLRARKNPDLEVIRRAEFCLREIEQNSAPALEWAAVRLLQVRAPAGAAEALLAWLPNSAGEEFIEDAALRALVTLGVREGEPHPALGKALTDPEPSRRAAAAHVLATVPARRPAVRRLLRDPEASVRYRAASALLLAADGAAVPALIGVIESGPVELAYRAEDLLGRAAGEKAPAIGLGNADPASRRRCRAGWEGWWKANEGKVDLTQLGRQGALLGLTLVCDCSVGGASRVGKLWAVSRDGKARWEMDGVFNPADVQLLPGGRYLVAECMGQRFTERDRKGKILWEHKVTSYPVSCQRLPNGNTFLATYGEISEVTPAGKVVYNHSSAGRGSFYCAQKLRNGNILYAQGDGRVVEMEVGGKEVRVVKVGGLGSWAGVEPLPGGRYPVAQYALNQVVEVDSKGKVLWECKIQTPAWATRLRNGHTLIASPDGRKVVEVDQRGKEVWTVSTKGRPFRIRRY